MQNAKDTFYEMLRDRVIAGNAGRTVVVRDAVRPAVIVDENEVVDSEVLLDCFRLQWGGLAVDAESATPATAMDCVISYATAGTANAGGMDRGRALAAMDGELLAALNASPQWTQKKNFAPLASGGTAVGMQSRVWWSDVVFGLATDAKGLVERKATVTVFSFREAGEV